MSINLKAAALAGIATIFLGACERRDTQPPAATAPATADRTAQSPPTATPRTPLDQSENVQDVGITAAIRKAVMEDKSMSTAAQNCTIVTVAGVVTLRGQVNTAAERDAIGSKAGAVPGVTRVDNQLEVKPQ